MVKEAVNASRITRYFVHKIYVGKEVVHVLYLSS